MKVATDLVVSLAYQVRTEDGVLVDESPASAPLDYLHGRGSLISGLESALEGRIAGDVFDVDVGANDAYGQYDENLVQRVPKDVFMGVEELEVGMRFLADTDMGPVPVEITGVEGDEVIVDGNHMLAGQNLKFHVEVMGVREATAEELEHGHVHGEGEEGGCCGGHGHGEEGGCCGGGHHDHDHGEEGGCCGGGHHDHDHEHGEEGGCCGGGQGKGHGKGHGNGGCGCH
ncbi:peptidylprolyl isomerase [Morganella psychrotolerans]|uniref:peptidylprolyl isomerase n=1 Tax=Morganella psychrotolerans TaxID=368603 RepID=UPI0039AFA492